MSRKKLVQEETEEFETDLRSTNRTTTTTTTAAISDSSDLSDEGDDSESDEDDILARDSDEDGPPTSVSFIQSRESAVQKIRDAISQISANDRKKKDRRKWLDEKYKKQKEERLKILSSARLPDDILADIPSQPKKQKSALENEKLDNTETDDHLGHCNHGNSEEEEEVVQISEEFLPLDYNRYADVTVISNSDKKTNQKGLAESAAEFRQTALYGSRIRREPTRNRMAKAAKKKAQFT